MLLDVDVERHDRTGMYSPSTTQRTLQHDEKIVTMDLFVHDCDAAEGRGMATGSCVSASLVAPNHFCADQDHPTVRQIAARLPWYTPKYSPHDVPRFYDITGVVRRRRPRRPPCRISSPCVCIPRFACSLFRGADRI